MAKTGRPPLPENVRRLHGEKRPSQSRVELQPNERAPQPPAWLTGESRAVWDRITVELDAMGILFALDTDPLAALCSTVALFYEAERHLRRDGYVIADNHGDDRRSPWILIRRDAVNEIMRLGQAFAMTPQARANMAKPVKESEPPGAELLAG